ncbi:MAG TPA: NADH-quinone oxidoreductase subunit A [Ktedonobacterales bacterium]|nr:NADH-quinone oxidoreductase subunit A [Ktedonobacterales bacterium]
MGVHTTRTGAHLAAHVGYETGWQTRGASAANQRKGTRDGHIERWNRRRGRSPHQLHGSRRDACRVARGWRGCAGRGRWLSPKRRPTQDNPPPKFGGGNGHKTWVQLRLRYAVVALLFIAFDMEMVFMFPWAVAFRRMGLTALIDMFVFIW